MFPALMNADAHKCWCRPFKKQQVCSDQYADTVPVYPSAWPASMHPEVGRSVVTLHTDPGSYKATNDR